MESHHHNHHHSNNNNASETATAATTTTTASDLPPADQATAAAPQQKLSLVEQKQLYAAQLHANQPERNLNITPEQIWMGRYQELVDFHKANGHCWVPNAPHDRNRGSQKQRQRHLLWQWTHQQRQQHKLYNMNPSQSTLTAQQMELLNALDLKPNNLANKNDQEWNTRFAECVCFWKEHGHSKVPCRAPKSGSKGGNSNKSSDNNDAAIAATVARYPKLGKWVSKQRQHYLEMQRGRRTKKPHTKTVERFALLSTLDFQWVVQDHLSWKDGYEQLKAYLQDNPGPSLRHAPPRLTKWVRHQLRIFRPLLKQHSNNSSSGSHSKNVGKSLPIMMNHNHQQQQGGNKKPTAKQLSQMQMLQSLFVQNKKQQQHQQQGNSSNNETEAAPMDWEGPDAADLLQNLTKAVSDAPGGTTESDIPEPLTAAAATTGDSLSLSQNEHVAQELTEYLNLNAAATNGTNGSIHGSFSSSNNKTNGCAWTALHQAVVNHNTGLEVVDMLARICPEMLETRDPKLGRTPLHVACARSQGIRDQQEQDDLDDKQHKTPAVEDQGEDDTTRDNGNEDNNNNGSDKHGETATTTTDSDNPNNGNGVNTGPTPQQLSRQEQIRIRNRRRGQHGRIYNDQAMDCLQLELVQTLLLHNRRTLILPDFANHLPLNVAYHLDPESAVTELMTKETLRGV